MIASCDSTSVVVSTAKYRWGPEPRFTNQRIIERLAGAGQRIAHVGPREHGRALVAIGRLGRLPMTKNRAEVLGAGRESRG
jgi:hypothetical protein